MKLTTEELQQKIDSGEKFIVDLYADWCGPCRMIGPIVEKVGKQLEEEVNMLKKENYALNEKYNLVQKRYSTVD